MLYKSNIKAARKMKRAGALLKERERILRELEGLEDLRVFLYLRAVLPVDQFPL